MKKILIALALGIVIIFTGVVALPLAESRRALPFDVTITDRLVLPD
uniref:Uncharacterized protein n=1 Tax=viral metagenome TaxID=1070528 RepID=A0A6C0BMW6_9ZZZZ